MSAGFVCNSHVSGQMESVEPLLGRSISEISSDLERLKAALIEMRPEDLDQVDSAEMAAQISVIRLQLKRLEADRQALQ
jgi:hypothetical protein